MRMRATNQILEAAALGGTVLSAGAGGEAWHKNVLDNGRLALQYGKIEIVSLDELPDDAIVITVSNIGAPSAPRKHSSPSDLVRAAQLLIEQCDGKVVGIMNSESTRVNGWIQAAALNLVLVDASGDGRGHPTIEMGALGLHDSFETIQTAVGGDSDRIELIVKGVLIKTAKILRQAAVQSGGLIGSARMPLPVSMLKERAAIGAISYQIGFGQAMLKNLGNIDNMLDAMTEYSKGKVLAVGTVEKVNVEMINAFDIGEIVLSTEHGILSLTVCNEYMAATLNGRRISVFPDLIATLSMETGMPVAIKEMQVGHSVAVFHVEKDKIPLGQGALDLNILRDLEDRCGLKFID